MVPMTGDDEELKQLMEDFEIQLLTSERGQLLDLSITSSKSEELNSDIELGLKELKELFTGVVRPLPQRGVVTGDKVFDWDLSFVLPDTQGERVSISIDAVARGSTRFNDRSSLVVDFSGFAILFGGKLPIHGFGVLDIETGAWTHSNVIWAALMNLENETVEFRIHEIRNVDLKRKPAAMPDRPPSRDSLENRLERLKRLLDRGLISPQDAEEKRQEILKQL